MEIEDHELLQEDRDRLRGQELLNIIDFGLQVRAFLDSKVGQRIQVDAEGEAKALMLELVDLDPDNQEDRDQMRNIRQKIGILNHWQDAFAGYILAGRQAELEYQESE